jgi:RNA polymerase sigma-70 factor (ECF subfamily)
MSTASAALFGPALAGPAVTGRRSHSAPSTPRTDGTRAPARDVTRQPTDPKPRLAPGVEAERETGLATADDEVGGDFASPEEQRLVARVQQGDTAAFATLVDRHVERAHTIARRLMASPEDAEDLVQDAFLRALERIGKLDRRRPFGPWFFRLLINTGLDTHRRHRVRRTEPEAPQAPSLERNPLQQLEGGEIRERFEAALAELPSRQRLIVWAYEVDGQSTEEIARSLGVTQVTVRSHLHHGRRALREALRPVKD